MGAVSSGAGGGRSPWCTTVAVCGACWCKHPVLNWRTVQTEDPCRRAGLRQRRHLLATDSPTRPREVRPRGDRSWCGTEAASVGGGSARLRLPVAVVATGYCRYPAHSGKAVCRCGLPRCTRQEMGRRRLLPPSRLERPPLHPQNHPSPPSRMPSRETLFRLRRPPGPSHRPRPAPPTPTTFLPVSRGAAQTTDCAEGHMYRAHHPMRDRRSITPTGKTSPLPPASSRPPMSRDPAMWAPVADRARVTWPKRRRVQPKHAPSRSCVDKGAALATLPSNQRGQRPWFVLWTTPPVDRPARANSACRRALLASPPRLLPRGRRRRPRYRHRHRQDASAAQPTPPPAPARRPQ